MDCSSPTSSVLHYFPEFAQMHSHWASPAMMLMLSNYLILCHPLLLLPSVFPSIRVFSKEWVLRIRWPKYWCLSFLKQHSFQWILKSDLLFDWLVWAPFKPRDSQQPSRAPQFKSINSLALHLHYGQPLTSLHDCWESHSFDYTDLSQQTCSVQFSCSVVSDSLQPHEPQHARPPCPSPTPRVHPNPCPLCQWYHPAISSSVIPFSSCPQAFPASGSFPMSQLSTSGGQSIGVSVSTSIPPMNTRDWSPLGWTGWISL